MSSSSPALRRVGWTLVALASAYLGSGTAAGLMLTRRASVATPEPAPEGYELLRLRTSDGEEIGAWLGSSASDDLAVVIAHGNGSSRSALLDEANDLRARGCTVMPISLRAHGDSSGFRNDMGWSARHDIAAAVRHLRELSPRRPVLVMGTSLGAAAALFAGAEEDLGADAYVLVGVFAYLRAAVRRRTRRYLPRGIDALAYGALWAASPLFLPELDSISPARAALRLPADTRALFLVGADDDRAPLADSETIAYRLHQARVVVLPGLDHEDLEHVVEQPAWSEAIDELLAAVRGTALEGDCRLSSHGSNPSP